MVIDLYNCNNLYSRCSQNTLNPMCLCATVKLTLLGLAYLTWKKYLVVCYHMSPGLVDVVHLHLLDANLVILLEVQVENRTVNHQGGTTNTEAQKVIVVQVCVDIVIDCLKNFPLLFLHVNWWK